MLNIEDVIKWLSEGKDWKAIEILSQCDFYYDDVDFEILMEIEMADGIIPNDFYVLKIGAPRRIYDLRKSDLESEVKIITDAIYECSQSRQVNIQDIQWVPRLQNDAFYPINGGIEDAISVLNSNQVKIIWAKAMSRRQLDPDGAITAAKTLIESVCKHILTKEGVEYPSNPDITKLYHLASKQLNISASQHTDEAVKKVLGNCQAVVGGISHIRNKLGDAHSPEPDEIPAISSEAELLVNLAGTISTFLIQTWESQKQKRSCKDRKSADSL